jgi:hypothetical protein
VERALVEMKATFDGSDLRAKRDLLKKQLVGVELGRDRGKVAFTFPLHVRVYIRHPRGSTKDRTASSGP